MSTVQPQSGIISSHAAKATQQGRQSLAGQSLVEFVLVMPLLVLIFLGGFSFGMGMYDAHLASDAIQLPAAKKLDMASKASSMGSGDLIGYVTSGGTSGTLSDGNLLDSINPVTVDNYTSVMVGSKTFSPLVDFLPGFTITTAETINKGLLDAPNSGATVRPAGTPWVPGGAPQMPPWAS